MHVHISVVVDWWVFINRFAFVHWKHKSCTAQCSSFTWPGYRSVKSVEFLRSCFDAPVVVHASFVTVFTYCEQKMNEWMNEWIWPNSMARARWVMHTVQYTQAYAGRPTWRVTNSIFRHKCIVLHMHNNGKLCCTLRALRCRLTRTILRLSQFPCINCSRFFRRVNLTHFFH